MDQPKRKIQIQMPERTEFLVLARVIARLQGVRTRPEMDLWILLRRCHNKTARLKLEQRKAPLLSITIDHVERLPGK